MKHLLLCILLLVPAFLYAQTGAPKTPKAPNPRDAMVATPKAPDPSKRADEVVAEDQDNDASAQNTTVIVVNPGSRVVVKPTKPKPGNPSIQPIGK